MPYHECKVQLKFALSQTTDAYLRSIILHNLVVLNFCEIQDHNERVLNPEYDSHVMEQLEKVEAQKSQDRKDNKEIRRQIDLQEREVKKKERKLELKALMSKETQKLTRKFKKTGMNKVLQKKALQMAEKYRLRLERSQNRMNHLAQRKASKESLVIDRLLNSSLPPQILIRDALNHGYNINRLKSKGI